MSRYGENARWIHQLAEAMLGTLMNRAESANVEELRHDLMISVLDLTRLQAVAIMSAIVRNPCELA